MSSVQFNLKLIGLRSVMVIRDVEVGVIINFDAKECRVYTEGSKDSPTSQEQKDK